MIRPARGLLAAACLFSAPWLISCGGDDVAAGDQGSQDAGGPEGPRGEVGPQGPQGETGAQGEAGAAGTLDPSLAILNQDAEPQAANLSISGTARAGFFTQSSRRDIATAPAIDVLRIDLESTTAQLAGPLFQLRNDGSLLARGFVRDVGATTGCASFVPATGTGTRFMWHPCRGAVRFGRVPLSRPTAWDDANLGDFTFAGGNDVLASGYGAFAYGDAVTVTGTVGVGFGSSNSVTGTAGFTSGAQNVCSGFACTAMGYTTTAGGQGSVALGYRAHARQDYTVAIGYRANTNTREGAMLLGTYSPLIDASNELLAQQDGELRVRAPGGVKLRTSINANAAPGSGGNTGCDLPAGSGTFTCASSRKLKSGFETIDGEVVLSRLRKLELSTWRFNEDGVGARHLGPVAEDFHAAYGLGSGNSSIGVQDLAGVALAAAQALEKRTHELDARTREVEDLKSLVRAMEKRLVQLEKQGAAH